MRRAVPVLTAIVLLWTLIGCGWWEANGRWNPDDPMYEEAGDPSDAVGSVPVAPSQLVAVVDGPARVRLVWQDNSSYEAAFVVQRKSGDAGEFAPLEEVLEPDATTCEDTTVEPLQRYVYRVKATNSTGDSAWAAEAGVTAAPALSGLGLSCGTLSPAFVPAVTSYTAEVDAECLTVTPTSAGGDVLIAVGGMEVASGSECGAITLTEGENPVEIVLTPDEATVSPVTYTVAVTRITGLSSNAELASLSFSAGTLEPAFDAMTTTYGLIVPSGTGVVTVTATAAGVGATVSVNGTAVESGVASEAIGIPAVISIEVTAGHGETRSYTVTVTVAAAPSQEKELTAFSFPATLNGALSADAVGTIVGAAVGVSVPADTVVTDLTAVFATTGVNVYIGPQLQQSGTTTNDFTGALTYTVYAEDGSHQDYAVTVTIQGTDAKEITAYAFLAADNSALASDAFGLIDGTTITVDLPYGTDVTALVATFGYVGASVKVGSVEQESGTTPNNFVFEVAYRVTATDDSWVDYSVAIHFPSWVDLGNPSIFTVHPFTQCYDLDIVSRGTDIYAAHDSSSYQIYIYKYNDVGDWTQVGTTLASGYTPRVAFLSNGDPVVAWYKSGGGLYVHRWNGSSWVAMAAGGVDGSNGDYVYDFASDSTGNLFIFYRAASTNYGNVRKYTGSAWSLVGGANFIESSVSSLCLVFDSSDTPYVGYTISGGLANLKVYNSGTEVWDQVGPANFVVPGGISVGWISLAFDDAGLLWAALKDGSGLTVMQYTGSDWEVVGSRLFVGNIGRPIMAFDLNGVPTVIYVDFAGTATVGVKKFMGGSWVNITGSTPGTVYNGNFTGTINGAGQVVVSLVTSSSSPMSVKYLDEPPLSPP